MTDFVVNGKPVRVAAAHDARLADWKTRRPGRGLGIAYSGDLGSHVAIAAEISLDAGFGTIRLHRLWCAADIGIAIQPENARAQIEGGIVFVLGAALCAMQDRS